MKRYFLAAAIAVSFAAFADSEFRQGADFVRVTAEACKDAQVLAHIASAGENALDYRAARAEVNGTPFNACWKPIFSQHLIQLRYSDGEQGLIPFDYLKPVKVA